MSSIKFNQWLNTDNTENFKCRAWVNFNGTGTVAIRASGNVSSITDGGVADFRINFATPMPDANYSLVGTASGNAIQGNILVYTNSASIPKSTTSAQVITIIANSVVGFDSPEVCVAVYR